MSGRDIRQLVREYARRGWTITVTGGGHLRWEHPDADEFVISSSTPSCPFAPRKVRAQLDALVPPDEKPETRAEQTEMESAAPPVGSGRRESGRAFERPPAPPTVSALETRRDKL